MPWACQFHGDLICKAATDIQFLGSPDFHTACAKTTDISENMKSFMEVRFKAKACFNWKSAAIYALKLLKSVGFVKHTQYPFDFSGSFSLSTLHFY